MAALVAILGGFACQESPQTYDVWIQGGTIIDGTGGEPYVADVLITGDTIVHLGPVESDGIEAATVIDARGKTVTPGFLDPHSHGDPLEARFDNFLAQGVTTVVLGQDGRTPGFPREDPPTLEAWREAVASPDSGEGVVTLAQWMRAVEREGSLTNVATLVGHGSVRRLAGVGSDPDPTDAELVLMTEILQTGLDAGAFGMSSGLEYVPGRNAPEDEIMALARVVGENDGVIMTHMRSEDGAVRDPGNEDAVLMQDALEEVIAQGEHARVHVAHIKIVYGKSAEEGEAVLARLREARSNGIEISADVYPYLAGMSNFYFLYPIWARERPVFEDAVENDRQKLADDMYERVMWRGGPDKALITSGEYAGKNLAEIAEIQGKPFVDVIIDWGYGGPTTAHFTQNAEVQDVFITAPDVAIGTDGSPAMRHPRSFGTYPKMIEEYVVDEEKLTLPVAIRKMSGLPAEILGLEDRGTLAVGHKADILVFDPNVVEATATWEEPQQYPEGFDTIFVNGRIAVRSGEVADASLGRILRKTTN